MTRPHAARGHGSGTTIAQADMPTASANTANSLGRRIDAARKRWVAAVNHLSRWGYAELRYPFAYRDQLDRAIDAILNGKAPS